ncbi:MAG TPA: VOC family protein [Planctomycetota bacterium]|nr:VOC family protein [Planctomycetota bacterium]
MSEMALAHLAIAVEELDQATPIYAALGFELGDVEQVVREKVRLRKCVKDGLCIELLEAYPKGEGSVAKFIAKRGACLHHVAISSKNVRSDLRRLGKSGIKALAGYPAEGSEGTTVAFLDPKTTGGVLIELVERLVLTQRRKGAEEQKTGKSRK